MPWLDEQTLFEEYSLEDAWNDDTNAKLFGQRPLAYACPEVVDPTHTSYQAAVSLRTPWPYDTPAQVRDFTDGTSNTLMLFDVHDPEVVWTQPKDLTLQQATNAAEHGQKHFSGNTPVGINVLLADGSARFLSRDINPETLHGLLTPSGGRPLPSDRMSKDSLARASEEILMPGPAAFGEPIKNSSLPATHLSPGAGESLMDGTTTVYCPTMALAWKQYIEIMPQVVETPLAMEMRQNPFSKADIDESALEINLTTADTLGPQVNCKLMKHLAFASEFDAHKLPLAFHDSGGSHDVKAFGVTSHWSQWRAALAQIRVIDYQSPDDFVIAIGNLSGEDLILAKIPRPDTLEQGITGVSNRIRDSRLSPAMRSVVEQEQVVIPVLLLSVKENFEKELNHADQPAGPVSCPSAKPSSFDSTNAERSYGRKQRRSAKTELTTTHQERGHLSSTNHSWSCSANLPTNIRTLLHGLETLT